VPLPNNAGLGGDVGALKPPRMEDQPHANILTGYGAPAATLGQVGMVYINLAGGTNTRLYQKTGASTWQALTTG
jgi:hypothetical protein